MSRNNSPAFSTKEKASRIDLGLAISRLTMEPGECRTLAEIAAYCGCSRQGIQYIEQKAILKVRKRLRDLLGIDFKDHRNDFIKALRQ